MLSPGSLGEEGATPSRQALRVSQNDVSFDAGVHSEAPGWPYRLMPALLSLSGPQAWGGCPQAPATSVLVPVSG